MPVNKQDLLKSNDDEFSLPLIPEEELQRLTLDEDLSETERIMVLLTKKDQPAQLQYVFTNSLNIFKGNASGIQQQIMPIIIKGISTYSEQVQIEAGKAFIQLLEQDIIDSQFYKDLKNLCHVMLKQWSKAILTEWISVYITLIMKMKHPPFLNECIDNAFKLLESQQPVSVKESASYFIGLIAKKKFLGLTDTSFMDRFYPKITELANYCNWKVRISICRQIFSISEYIGEQKTIELIFPILKSLIEDSEQEVQRKAIKQMFELVTKEVFSQKFTSSNDFSQLLKYIMGIASSPGCSMSTRNSVFKVIGNLIKHLSPEFYAIDKDFQNLLISLLKIACKSDFGRLFLPSISNSLISLYQKNGKFADFFYPEVISDYVQNELQSQGLTKDIKKEIAQNLPHFLLSSLKSQNDQVTYDIASKCNTILKNTNREIINEFVVNIYEVFDYMHQFKDVLSSRLQDMLNQLIKKPMLETLEPVIIQNWRFHLNYFQLFLSKYLHIADKDEATLIVFPLFLHGLKSPKASLPVKKYISQLFAELIETQSNLYLRLSIQEGILKDFAGSDSSQLRQVFVYFLEALLPKISKTYFKQVFFDAYLSLASDHVYQIQLHYINLAPLVRQKLDDLKSIESLLNSIKIIKSDKEDIQNAVKTVLSQLKDPKFLQQVQMHQVTVDHEIAEKEHQLREIEKTQRDSTSIKKQKDMEQFFKMMRDDSVLNGASFMSNGSPRSQNSSSSKGGTKTEMTAAPRGRNFIIGQASNKQQTLVQQPTEESKVNPFKSRRGSNSGLKILPTKLAPQMDRMASKTPKVPLNK